MGRMVSKTDQLRKAENLVSCAVQRQQDAYGLAMELEAFVEDSVLSGEAYTNAKGYVREICIPIIKALCMALEDEASANREVISCCNNQLTGVDFVEEDTIRSEISRLQGETISLMDDWWDYLPFISGINTIRIACNQSRIKKLNEELEKLEAYDDATRSLHDNANNQLSSIEQKISRIFLMDLFSGSSFNYSDVEMGWAKPFLQKWNSFSRLEELEYGYIMEVSYGFSPEQAALIKKTYSKVKDEYGKNMTNVELANKFWGMVASLCINYDAKRWHMVANTDKHADVMKELRKLGLTEQEVLDLVVLINNQHGEVSEARFKEFGIDAGKSKYSDKAFQDYWNASDGYHKDFAHEAISLAIMSNEIDPDDISLWSMLEGVFTHKGAFVRSLIDIGNASKETGKIYTNFEANFKGDIDSTRYDEGDFASDLDAISTYYDISKKGGEPFNAFVSYNSDVYKGTKNRAMEFLNALGDGSEGVGWWVLLDVLDAETYGSEYIRQEHTKEELDKANAAFLSFLVKEYKKAKR